ncbi:YbaY family lipoprotein [Vibrio coralliilyticus]|uniref:YbaY family lipoprotein n=1 Tax=Vibrio coralliilyticus TaxID=190893 RepID=UPI00051273D2|nr:YbaY family lipoprotein [Vibrio coralliilyticus]AIU67348.1 lipo-like protein [Vibrio coralliilyticus]
MKKALMLFVSAVLGMTLFGCQSPQNEEGGVKMTAVSGTVAYRQFIALPDNALVTVTLQDISLADAPATVIAKHRFETGGTQVPFEFELAFDPRKIKPHHTYSVSARIEVDGQLRFISDTVYPVITDQNQTSHVDLVLVGVSH